MQMMALLESLGPVWQAFLAGCFTWGLTALGAGTVFFTRGVERRVLDLMLGFAAGVMIAASYWSLLAPAVELSAGLSVPVWLPPAAGFLAGGLAMWVTEALLPYLHPDTSERGSGSRGPGMRRSSLMLILAVTVHNIPEGLAVGVGFGALAAAHPSATLAGAVGLAVGIGLQNFPEGMAVSMPLRREGFSRLRSFWYGQLSGVVEPAAAVFGAAAVIVAAPVLPYALAFAAGAMIFVVAAEVIPEAQGSPGLATLGVLAGFVVMMVLDVALG
ncbi:ZIP family zinc transporter [Methanofollis sp. W23]|uniref:ZIP family metal transporter n=1 Tax=Methanofollis sp. W23 TaxID=2817849 RepID=UPI001D34CD32|nr:ZIP family metal transporter [Methanofollis sp. W23]MBP2145509.1 ZIP family zinc transporter [Methanofollis sp. W23]